MTCHLPRRWPTARRASSRQQSRRSGPRWRRRDAGASRTQTLNLTLTLNLLQTLAPVLILTLTPTLTLTLDIHVTLTLTTTLILTKNLTLTVTLSLILSLNPAGGATQALTFDVYMQTDRGSNNSCVVTAYDSQVRRTQLQVGYGLGFGPGIGAGSGPRIGLQLPNFCSRGSLTLGPACVAVKRLSLQEHWKERQAGCRRIAHHDGACAGLQMLRHMGCGTCPHKCCVAAAECDG